ncbi:MAG: hypothetical protein FWF76_03425 [Oscillospiraceae bacterium]|nr:hypothetical protein [Oscillospiraceae bacterium]
MNNIIPKDLMPFFEIHTVKTKPVYTLIECITVPENKRISNLGINDDEFDGFAGGIKERFRAAVYLINQEERDFLDFAVGVTEKRAKLEESIEFRNFNVFSFNEYVFLFLHGEEYHLVMPVELIEIYREVVSEADYAEKNALNLDLYRYSVRCSTFTECMK